MRAYFLPTNAPTADMRDEAWAADTCTESECPLCGGDLVEDEDGALYCPVCEEYVD